MCDSQFDAAKASAGSLRNLLQAVEQGMCQVSFEEDLTRYSLPPSEQVWLRNEPYYKGLAEFVRVSGVRRVLEIGTLFGGSAIALAKYAEEVVAADIDLSRAEQSGLFGGKVLAWPLADAEACLTLPLVDFDTVFVDIDHSGRVESRLHERFREAFCGVVFYDDIQLNSGMWTFWEAIEEEKVATTWHHSGFGAVLYRGHTPEIPTSDCGSSFDRPSR